MSDTNSSKKIEKILEVPYWSLFRYATLSDKILLSISFLLIICSSAGMPGLNIVWGDATNAFNFSKPGDDVLAETKINSRNFALIGLGLFLLTGLSLTLAKITGQRQGQKIRALYFRAILRQEIGWFDTQNPAALSARVEDECKTIIEGMEEKLLLFVQSFFVFLGCFGVGYYRGWHLALIVTGVIPLLIFSTFFFSNTTSKINSIKVKAYTKAGGLAEQALNAIRTVISLNGDKKEVKQYKEALDDTERALTKYGLLQGLSFGSINFTIFILMGTGFLVSSRFIENGTHNPGTSKPYNAGDIITVFFAIIFGIMGFSIAGPSIKAIQSAKQAAYKVFQIIERDSLINHELDSGLKPNSVSGNIKFEKVQFNYPANPEKKILQNLSLHIEANKKTALVGESGCGKSTCIQLIERMYDPQNGDVFLDGQNLKELNLAWLRRNIAYVGQEPVLFSMTIRENLALAREGISESEMLEALKIANVYDFVMSLEQKLDTFVGNLASQISGGQKQRIAIARAILRNAKIWLLDEATSALDAKNEREIQETLDKISKDHTTIIVSHRLSTIKNADKIILLSNGIVAESGTHQELLNLKGKYFELHGHQITNEDNIANPLPQSVEKKDIIEEKAASAEKVEIIVEKVSQISPERDSTTKTDPKSKAAAKKDNTLSRLISESKPERKLVILSVVFAFLNGLLSPLNSFVISKIFSLLLNPTSPDFGEESKLWSCIFYALGLASITFYSLQLWLFALTAERFIKRFRAKIFHKMLRMPMAWHDDPSNSPAILTAALSTEANNVASYVGSGAGMMVQALSSMIGALGLSFWASWQLSLLCLGLFPIMGAAGAAQVEMLADKPGTNEKKENLQICSESINNIRTVATLGSESFFFEKYEALLPDKRKKNIKTGAFQGFVIGISNAMLFFFFAVVFLVGSILTVEYDLSVEKMFIGMFALTFAASDLGTAMQMMPDAGKGAASAKRLFAYLDAKSSIDVEDETGKIKTPIKGDIEFKNVSFKYPSRAKQIFKNLSFKISSAKKSALVGASGCGKSTVFQLLLRLYDVDEGEILIDGVDIKKYDLRHLRQQLSIVSQEPVLFDGTIDFNIRYSKEDASTEEVRRAAEIANALKFIENNEFDDMNKTSDLGQGFDRKVGPKGSQISGGQKQRIAIARAMIRKPNVLLLDEATSALDSQNEQIVHQNLLDAMKGQGSFTISHRFSTIRNSDDIIVFKDGEIVERGTYEQMNAAKGHFYMLEKGIF